MSSGFKLDAKTIFKEAQWTYYCQTLWPLSVATYYEWFDVDCHLSLTSQQEAETTDVVYHTGALTHIYGTRRARDNFHDTSK